MIRSEDLGYSYTNGGQMVEALAGVTFEVSQGSTCAVIGPSGCGKTTLLYLLAGLLAPSRGRVLVNEAAVTGPRPGTALILQDYGLLPWKTVLANAGLGLELKGVGPRERQAIVRPLLARLGLDGLEGRYPAQLSGGQKQRVAIARAMAMQQDILLMDEPFSALDALTREEMQEALTRVRAEQGLTIVMVTHSVEEAVYLGERIVILGGLPGRVQAVLENPGAGSAGWRSSAGFHQTCARVRALFRRDGHDAA